MGNKSLYWEWKGVFNPYIDIDGHGYDGNFSVGWPGGLLRKHRVTLLRYIYLYMLSQRM